MSFNIWEGIYENFESVPKTEAGFSGEKWVQSQYDLILEKRKNNIPTETDLLASICSTIELDTDTLRILDFGGGMGQSYQDLNMKLSRKRLIYYTVVEDKNVCLKAKQLFENDSQINFDYILPEEEFDIVYISSSLQYVDEWKGLLLKLLEMNPQYIIFNDLPAGNIKHTYATIQNYYESKIPYWFFSLKDIKELFLNTDYDLIFSSIFRAKILGKFEEMPQDNFPEEYRVGYSKKLIYRLKK